MSFSAIFHWIKRRSTLGLLWQVQSSLSTLDLAKNVLFPISRHESRMRFLSLDFHEFSTLLLGPTVFYSWFDSRHSTVLELLSKFEVFNKYIFSVPSFSPERTDVDKISVSNERMCVDYGNIPGTRQCRRLFSHFLRRAHVWERPTQARMLLFLVGCVCGEVKKWKYFYQPRIEGKAGRGNYYCNKVNLRNLVEDELVVATMFVCETTKKFGQTHLHCYIIVTLSVKCMLA